MRAGCTIEEVECAWNVYSERVSPPSSSWYFWSDHCEIGEIVFVENDALCFGREDIKHASASSRQTGQSRKLRKIEARDYLKNRIMVATQ